MFEKIGIKLWKRVKLLLLRFYLHSYVICLFNTFNFFPLVLNYFSKTVQFLSGREPIRWKTEICWPLCAKEQKLTKEDGRGKLNR